MTARKIDESLVEMMRFVVHHYLDCNHKLGGTTKSSKPLSEVEQITGVNYGDMLSSVFLIEKTKTFKYGDGLEIMAFASGKNPVNGKEIKLSLIHI